MFKRLLLAFAVVGIGTALGFRYADSSTPEATVKAFVVAVEKADMKAAAKLVKGGRPNADYSVLVQQIKKQPVKIQLIDLKSKTVKDKASVSYNLRVSSGREQAMSTQETLQLQKTGNAWLIVPPAEPDPKMVLAGIAAITVDPQKMLTQARDSAMSAACLSNVKQICLGLIMLSADHDDVLDFKVGSWKSATMPYIKNESIYHCPADPSGAVSYSINPSVVGKSVTAISEPANTVLVYEGKNGVLAFRHQNRAIVGYCDGHVKRVTRQQAKDLRWKP